ncbi:MAG: protein kinase, partial [Nannocystis sp.]
MTGISSAPLGDRVNGRFVLKAPLRHSGVVQAFLALDHQTGRDVALSLFDPACARPEAWAAFAGVVAAAAGAGIEGLVLPRGVEPTPPVPPHCVHEPQAGRGLDRLREQDGPMPWERALALGERIAAVLHSAQEATRVAHRALLPSRCLVTADDKVLLLDYGVAELELGGGQGESAYRAPEQRQASGDPRSDIFSLAVILFELISGKRPSTKMAPRLRSLIAVPPAVDTLMSKALAQDPAQRHPDPGALRAAIREVLGLEPVVPELPRESPAVAPAPAPAPVAVAEPELV